MAQGWLRPRHTSTSTPRNTLASGCVEWSNLECNLQPNQACYLPLTSTLCNSVHMNSHELDCVSRKPDIYTQSSKTKYIFHESLWPHLQPRVLESRFFCPSTFVRAQNRKTQGSNHAYSTAAFWKEQRKQNDIPWRLSRGTMDYYKEKPVGTWYRPVCKNYLW